MDYSIILEDRQFFVIEGPKSVVKGYFVFE